MQKNTFLPRIFPAFNTRRTREIFRINPTVIPVREEAKEVKVYVYDYNNIELEEFEFNSVSKCFDFRDSHNISWINIDGLRKEDVENISSHFNIHYLITEDILSVGQRPKMDEMDNILYCLLNMLYFNEQTGSVETEQISIVLGADFVITFQEDADRDVFNFIRNKLRIAQTKLRSGGADYLCYLLIDMIVDHYFSVMEKLSERIELLEEEIIHIGNTRSLARINSLRKELIVLKRNVSPVRDLVNGFVRCDSNLLEEKTIKYFKDVHDHILQANDMVENYRDMMLNMQDLYLNKANLKMNEVMKVMAIVTCLMAPATVIGGIFGMNFENIPLLHKETGFYIAMCFMLIIPLWMLWVFRKRGWF